MDEALSKFRPDRDLQCYFQEPSAVAALSETGANGFTVSGCWRQQFDWAVVEWNRDNVFEHPALRNLPDGDLSGLRLSYEETRTNCIPIDSTTYDSVGWSYLRIWEVSGGAENFHWVPLKPYATALDGSYVPPTVQFELTGTPTVGDYIELSWLDQHSNYLMAAGDTLETAVAGLAGFINAKGSACGVTAAADGARITLTYTGSAGSNGNRIGVYGSVHGAGTEGWTPGWAMFTGGMSPTRWRVDLDFANLTDTNQKKVTTTNVRKLRWTWAADLQPESFQRSEFAVTVSNWQVSGSRTAYSVAGPASRRIEDNAVDVSYTGSWTEERGNYSGGSIRHTKTKGDRLRLSYTAQTTHSLYLGTRYTDRGGQITVQVDSSPALTVNLKLALEDVLVRVPLGQLGAGLHTLTLTHRGDNGSDVYFDFLEIAIPGAQLPVFGTYPTMTLATDWDTNHSLAIAPERTAWLIHSLGFQGRANHYAGAMWFYELVCPDNRYASATIQFAGTPQFGGTTTVTIAGTPLQHLNLITDTPETIAKCFELLIAAGSSAVWAQANGPTLTITARAMGTDGNSITIAATTGTDLFTAMASGPNLAGSQTGQWYTDLNSLPRLNRAARDWSRSYYKALKSYGIDVAAAFSMELRDGDSRPAAGIAQRYPDGPCLLNTPAVQTNFGPASTAFWKQVYLDMAQVMSDAGITPYLQFGEVQWWYFADATGMPFYDDSTQSAFQAAYGRAMQTIPSEHADPTAYPEECAFLAKMIGEFTKAVMDFVRQTFPAARFEVLYPPDTNDTPLNRIINFPADHWTPVTLACLKTENFTYTGDRNLDKARESIELPATRGFASAQSSHLVGIGDYTTPWTKEQNLALGEGVESVVLFALDQFCLIGYGLPLDSGASRSVFMGG
jgi:hypothetical protein